MSDTRPTPETDAAWQSAWAALGGKRGQVRAAKMRDFAGTLERQRDEARGREDIARRQSMNLMIRLTRMVLIALRWRRKFASANRTGCVLLARCEWACARADRAEFALADQRRLEQVALDRAKDAVSVLAERTEERDAAIRLLDEVTKAKNAMGDELAKEREARAQAEQAAGKVNGKAVG